MVLIDCRPRGESMSYQDRHYYRDDDPTNPRQGGAADVGQRILRALNASFPVGTILGIRVRVHITFVILLLIQLFHDQAPIWTLRWAGLLFVSVLLHEFGHCLACRAVGGQANQILMWPLGGLAFCVPPHRPWPEFVTVIWGPLVNVILAAASFGFLYWRFSDSMPVTLNPFDLYVIPRFFLIEPFPKLIADLYVVNYGLLLFNLLLIFYPFDGGRLVQIALWTRMGYARSMRVATSLGMAGAILIGLFGVAMGNSMLVLIALFGFITCYQQARFVRQAGDLDLALDQAEGYAAKRPGFFQRWRQSRAQNAMQRRVNQQRVADEQVDRILDKVHREGLASLTDRERASLQRASQRKT